MCDYAKNESVPLITKNSYLFVTRSPNSNFKKFRSATCKQKAFVSEHCQLGHKTKFSPLDRTGTQL